jgi:hypothetical protein
LHFLFLFHFDLSGIIGSNFKNVCYHELNGLQFVKFFTLILLLLFCMSFEFEFGKGHWKWNIFVGLFDYRSLPPTTHHLFLCWCAIALLRVIGNGIVTTTCLCIFYYMKLLLQWYFCCKEDYNDIVWMPQGAQGV